MDFKISGGNAGAKISVTEIQSGEIFLASVKVELQEAAVPEKIRIEWKFPVNDCYSTWAPFIGSDRNLAPNWGKKRSSSRLASGLPVHQLVSRRDRNRMCAALSDAVTPITIGTGVCEEDACFDCVLELFTTLCAPLSEYSAVLRIDTRDIPFYDAVYDVVEWWEKDCGYAAAYVPDAARLPMDSLWYSFHQQLDVEGILKECALSKPLGMDTVIIDDGWQTDDNNRGYAYCGDWRVAPGKMGDMKTLVDGIHALGMKVMIWYSVPFVGRFSDKYKEFGDMLLDGWGDTFRFDPRYKEVRDYLVGVYTDAVKSWGLDGLKLDFIDAFSLSEKTVQPDPRRDFVGLEEAIDRLMTDVKESLTAINPDILIEFRQTYIGPSIRKYGNMFRVGDCPDDAFINRRNIIDMRLTSGNTPVHSDMLMWNFDEPVESAALQIASSLFAVPQISVKIDRLNAEHLKMLKFYLAFWRENREILLDGKLTAEEPVSGYSIARSSLGGKEIAACYIDPVIESEADTTVAVNCTGSDSLIVKNCVGREYTVINCMGETVSSGRIVGVFEEIAVPLCGMITVK